MNIYKLGAFTSVLQWLDLFNKDLHWYIYDSRIDRAHPYIVLCNTRNPTLLGVLTGKIKPIFVKVQYIGTLSVVISGYLWWNSRDHVGYVEYYSREYNLHQMADTVWQLLLDNVTFALQTINNGQTTIISPHTLTWSERIKLLFKN